MDPDRLPDICLVVILLFFTSCLEQAEQPKVVNHTAKWLENDQPFGQTELHFIWESSPGITQYSYQILMGTDKELLMKNVGNLWDSKRIFSMVPATKYTGDFLDFSVDIFWKVRIWDADDRETKFTPIRQVPKPQDLNQTRRFALLGGGLISGMEANGFLEQNLVTRWPNRNVSVINLGWPADDVFGLARSQFGSAQNTRSWKPPTAEEGFGSKVLLNHLVASEANVLIVGYGSEMAFTRGDQAMQLFSSGYKRILDIADSLDMEVIALSPPKQESVLVPVDTVLHRNQRLAEVRDYISGIAEERSLLFVDLFESLVSDAGSQTFTENGIRLNEKGYHRLASIITETMEASPEHKSSIVLDSLGRIVSQTNGLVRNWKSTVKGCAFDLYLPIAEVAHLLVAKGQFKVDIEGSTISAYDTAKLKIPPMTLRLNNLRATIKEKNRLLRQRLQPLNEAYIYLFRRHEMGHLAYEMEDLELLSKERQADIVRILRPLELHVEVELVRPWSPPRDYPEDEVPKFIPPPDIDAELSAFHLSDGLEINLFASDPMIANPININWDSRGRAWIATSSTYPHILPGNQASDRIVILEDMDRDGKADHHTVFAEDLMIPHSVMPVEGGAYVTSTTEFLFLGDTNNDDIADTKRIIFDGFGNADVHHMIHGLRWAPWGDLYFTQSIYINSFVETVHGIQMLNGSGIWQFRPEEERLMIFSRGLINPWGQAFDRWGQCFATDGAGSSGINYIYPGSAHASAVGVARIVDGLNSGTPKNTGAEFVYSPGLPDSWDGSIITSDFRANRTVRYQIEPEGSAYIAREAETILRSDHRSFRPVDMKIGPDGALYIVDWYNPVIDHGEVDFHHPVRDRSHGRVWRLSASDLPVPIEARIDQTSPADLFTDLTSPLDHTRLQANRELVRRRVDLKEILNWVNSLTRSDPDFEQHRLQGLWLCSALGYKPIELLMSVLHSPDGRSRAAGVRTAGQWHLDLTTLEPVINRLGQDSVMQVRLEILHLLRGLNTEEAAKMAISMSDMDNDENIETTLWNTMNTLKNRWFPQLVRGEDIFDYDINKEVYALLTIPGESIESLLTTRVEKPALRDTLARQCWTILATKGDEKMLDLVLKKAAETMDVSLLDDMADAPESNQNRPADSGEMDKFFNHDSASFRIVATGLIGRWGLNRYASVIVKRFVDSGLDREERIALGRALVKLNRLADVKKAAKYNGSKSVRAVALAVWAENDQREAAPLVVKLLQNLEDSDDVSLLFLKYRNMEDGPEILAEALAGKRLPEDVASTGLGIVQMSGLHLTKLEEAIRTAGSLKVVGGVLPEADKDQLVAEALGSANAYRGKSIYRRPELLCATCHRIDGFGGLVGPDLSTLGTYMTPHSILESLINPNTDIKQGYETVIVYKRNGEIVSGTLYRKTNTSTQIRLASGAIEEIRNENLEKMDVSPASLMPFGLTSSLHRDELRDLLSYLISLGKNEEE